MKTLTIRLTSPLQSFGNEATFARRTSGDYPSKSAIIGMIAAALGYRRDDKRISKLNELSFAVRVDQQGKTQTDFQTVEWKKNTRKVTYRDYLQDAVFMVGIGHENEKIIDEIRKALRQPKFQLFLGRRSNVPAGILDLKSFSDADPVTVLENMEWQASKWYQEKKWRQTKDDFVRHIEIIADANLLPGKRIMMTKDRVKSFNQRNRQYGYRSVAVADVKLKNPYVEQIKADMDFKKLSTDHDPMRFL
jgi:CRISPR system Cascade subunit CasD